MSPTIFFREIDGSFIVSILIPAHEYSIFIERESGELSMLIYLNRSFTSIEWLSDIVSLFGDRDDSTIEKDEVF